MEADYPAMGRLEDDLAAIQAAGLDLAGHVTLPDAAVGRFLPPMEARIAALRHHYAQDAEASAILGQLAEAPEMHRRCADFYAYVFLVARRPLNRRG